LRLIYALQEREMFQSSAISWSLSTIAVEIVEKSQRIVGSPQDSW
jgi:hypothetical protein